MAIDRKDRTILGIVQRDNMTPHRQIAEAVGLSTPAVTRRLGRLREQGYIRADVSILDQRLLERPLTIVAQVIADSEQLKALDAMRESFLRCPQVQHCYYVTGDADFVLIFNVADMAEYEALTRRLFIASGNVKRFTTFVAMETIKSGQEIAIEESRS